MFINKSATGSSLKLFRFIEINDLFEFRFKINNNYLNSINLDQILLPILRINCKRIEIQLKL